jgi:hypothetical protein
MEKELENQDIIEQPKAEQENIQTTETIDQKKQSQDFKYNKEEVNIAKLRAAKQKAEQERAEMAARLEELERNAATKDTRINEYGDDDFVEGKHLKKEMEAVKNEFAAYKAQQAAVSDEVRLKQVYNDFDKVVNNENLEKLKELDPETAEIIATSNASLYSRGSSAYKRIKELVIIEDKYEKDKLKAQENSSKPRPMNSVSPQQGDSPLSMANAFANGLTEDVKKQLWKEMQESTKRM